MKRPLLIPTMTEEQQTPVVKDLLGLLVELKEELDRLSEENRQLKDEIAILKGEKTRPRFKPSGMDKGGDGSSDSSQDEGPEGEKRKRPGSAKRSKTETLTIHRHVRCSPPDLPEGSRYKGYDSYIVQDLIIEARNTCYELAWWQLPDGRCVRGELPEDIRGHWGSRLRTAALYLHQEGRVTQPLLHKMFSEWGVDISAGQLNVLLTADHELFHQEKQDVLIAGLMSSTAITVDDTGARHQGKNGYTTQIGNERFAWFETTEQKNRINFLRLLLAGRQTLRLTADAFDYMARQGLPHALRTLLTVHTLQAFADEAAWKTHLTTLDITDERHVRIATEGLQVGCLLEDPHWRELAIVSDDAGQFDVPLLTHGLCWVHAERTIHKLVPPGPIQRQAQQTVRGQIWDLYASLKAYRDHPDPAQKTALSARFDAIFMQKTGYVTLDLTLKRLYKNRDDLLRVLERPDIPLHTNGSERDIREQVIRKKISGGTRSDTGRMCRDTFLSLKKTCRKLGVAFWDYLQDRIQGRQAIPSLAMQIRMRAEQLPASTY